MTSKVENHFSEAHFDMKSRFSPNLVMGIYGFAIYGNAIYGKAIYGKALYGKAIYGKAIYGKAIWQCHMAAAAAALRCNGRPETFFKELYPGKSDLKNKKKC